MRKRASAVSVIVSALLAVALAGMLVACGRAPAAQAAAEESVIEEILKRNVLKVGHDIFVPWAFKDKDGNTVGFEVDVARRLAEEMGVEIEFVPTGWAGIIPALLTGKFDVLIGGMGITTERALKVNFTNAYDHSGMDMIANKRMIPGKSSLEDFNREDIVIAVRMGATPVAAAQRFVPRAQLHQFDSDEAVVQDVLNGNAHAAMSSAPKPAFWETDYPDVLYRPLGGQLFTREPISFAVRKGDPDAMFFFNAWIARNEQWLRDRRDYWFGSKDWAHLLGE